jgi:copper chaperone CopZ
MIMKKLMLCAALILAFSTPVYADESVAVVPGDVQVDVNGLVCDFCARALEKVFGKEGAVKGIDVDLDEKVVTINFNEGQSLDDERIEELVMNAGYNVEAIRYVE